jgi:peptidoglycan hydrolase-like protein with peptidoglycan-binding domain
VNNRRRTLTIAASGAAVLALALAVTGLPGGRAKADDAGPKLASAEIARRTLVEQEELDGSIGHGEAVPVVNRRNGTLTWLAAGGSTVDRGEALYEVDGRKVPLLFGDKPAWRPLGPDTTGADVKQLKQNLVALGHATAAGLGTGDAWTAGTTEAVKRWQKAAGLDQDGTLDVGEFVFLPGAVIVAGQSGEVGQDARPGSEVLSATPAAPLVTVTLDAAKRGLVSTGDAVDIELPDGSTMPGTIAAIGAAESSDGMGGGGDQLEVQITPSGDTAIEKIGSLDGASVTVSIVRRKAENVLAVPVNALLALAEGGYGIELEGTGELLPVETGLFANGQVEVSGNGLEPGMKVVVPA